MSSEKRARPRPTVKGEEERAWVEFYRRVATDPTLAAEVLALLDADHEMRRMHLALYLSCKQSLRSHHSRQMRNQRIGQAVRSLCHMLFVVPWRSIWSTAQQGGEIGLACLPLPAEIPSPAPASARKRRRPDAIAAAPSTATSPSTAPTT